MEDIKLLNRVRKLLAMAEGAGLTDEERQTFTAKASEMMATYNIDRALLDATAPQPPKPAKREFVITAPFATVYASLIHNIGTVYNVKTIRIAGSRPLKVLAYGFESDLDRLEIIYTSVMLQMITASRKLDINRYGRGSVKAERRSWLLGYVSGVAAKLRAAEAAVVAEATVSNPGTELVLASREVAVQEVYKAAHPHVRNVRMSYSGSMYGSGYRAGQNANLHSGHGVGGTRRGALV